MDKTVNIREVETFWNRHPCEADAGTAVDRKKYFEEIEKYRYSHNPTIPRVSNFQGYEGKKVLEIGCGIGTDGRQFAKNRAVYTGINIDQASVDLAKESFKLFGLEGEILRMNAEQLKFPDNTFDHVFSLGVIHHTPATEQVVNEMFRVLKPGGTASVMVYNKSSINYHLEIMVLRKIFRLLLIPAFVPRLIAKITGFNRDKLERHRQLFLMEKKITKQRWISMNTDGPDCPLSKVYTRKEAQKLFARAGFIIKRNYTRYFNKTHYSFLGKLIPHCAANLIGKLWGWHRWIEVTKIHPQMIERSIEKFLSWLRDYGYYSYDHFDFWGSGLGVVAKRAWHSPPPAAPGVSRPTSNDHQQTARRATKSFDQTFSKVWPPAGPPEATNQSKAKKILAAPLVLSLQLLESFFPRSRILFAKKRRFAIGDAHFVQGFVNLYHYYRDPVYRDKAEEILPEIRSSATTTPSGIGWGYPYTWVTGRAIYPSGTPFITVTPYCFDAFLAMYDITGEKTYLDTAEQITRFAANDLNETIISGHETAVSYSPIDNSQVINASAYRAALLLKGFKLFGIREYKEKAVKNINFVLNQQQADGSWYYAVNERFIDHFHTCFVLKNLYKAYMILKDEKILKAVKKGYGYYREFLFRKDHTPIHFSKRGEYTQPNHGQPDVVLSGTSSQKFAEKKGGHTQPNHGQPDVVLSWTSSQKFADKRGWHPQPNHGQPDVVLSWTSSQKFADKRGWHPQPIHGQPDVVLPGTSSQKFADKIKFHQVLLKSINHKFRKIEMYDYAEGIALGPLLNPDIDGALDFSRQLAQHLIDTFQLKRGYFVTRVTSLNTRNKVPYLRWPQAQLFNALTTLLLTYSPGKKKKNVSTHI